MKPGMTNNTKIKNLLFSHISIFPPAYRPARKATIMTNNFKEFKPRVYQDLIINHEINIERCNIWAGMGMGKTVATLTALEDLHVRRGNPAGAGPRAAARGGQHLAG